ncbi:MAG: glycosyl transferase [Candidatus Aminicenantes bacterium RBG_13_62_12]|nr:MAG: glycosyl transferase [Candidatus Aminicenantes bacterium RBG_13_62_12]
MISVIIPAYNRAAFLSEALDSVLAQDYFELEPRPRAFEVLVVDDGSDDDTAAVVEGYGGRVRYVRRPHRGVSAARNAGLDRARGDFIAFLDSDDLWLRAKLRAQMSYLESFPEARVCCTEEIWVRGGRRVNPRRKHRKASGWIFNETLPLCLLSLSSALFRREVFSELGVFDESLPACEDYDFGLRLALRYPIHFLSTPLIIKKGGHPDQLSRQWGLDRYRVRCLVKLLSLDLTPAQTEKVRRELAAKCRVLASGLAKRGRWDEAEYYRGLAENPSSA